MTRLPPLPRPLPYFPIDDPETFANLSDPALVAILDCHPVFSSTPEVDAAHHRISRLIEAELLAREIAHANG